MKKYFLYELKKNFLPIVIFTVISSFIYVSSVIGTDFIYSYYTVQAYANPSLIAIPAVMLCMLCTIVPMGMYSFKMNRRSVDFYYSAPIKREKLYLVKSLVGLIMVLVPYTVCYWLGFVATALKPNIFYLVGFIPIFFISIPLAVLLFGINAFAFTRANSVHDGIIFMLLFTFVALFMFATVSKFISIRNLDFSFWFTYSPIVYSFAQFGEFIRVGHFSQFKNDWLVYLIGGLIGVACWVGLFLSVRTEKAENAEQVSTSWFGYKTLIPFYIAVLMGITDIGFISAIYVSMIFIGGVISYMIYRRTFKLPWQDWVTLTAALVLGIIISIIPNAPIVIC